MEAVLAAAGLPAAPRHHGRADGGPAGEPRLVPEVPGVSAGAPPPTLIAWGPQDGYMPEGAARAYLRDLPDAELHLLDGGHWLLETHLEEVVALVRDFLDRVHVQQPAP
ncbi:alpha/beta fold hydrolase [Streptomyces afghaniensis]|uniref:alpha/beta fold hydrolase n=1 Tax=Streptomyces afghaniensis TaxID=66865 RepID=UPI00314514E0